YNVRFNTIHKWPIVGWVDEDNTFLGSFYPITAMGRIEAEDGTLEGIQQPDDRRILNTEDPHQSWETYDQFCMAGRMANEQHREKEREKIQSKPKIVREKKRA